MRFMSPNPTDEFLNVLSYIEPFVCLREDPSQDLWIFVTLGAKVILLMWEGPAVLFHDYESQGVPTDEWSRTRGGHRCHQFHGKHIFQLDCDPREIRYDRCRKHSCSFSFRTKNLTNGKRETFHVHARYTFGHCEQNGLGYPMYLHSIICYFSSQVVCPWKGPIVQKKAH
jgi:hypothetical protein